MTATENFEQLLEQSIANQKMYPGAIITAKVIRVNQDAGIVTINAGLKSEGIISIDEFCNENGELEVTEGDTVEVALDTLEDGFGESIFSREKAKRKEAWHGLQKAHDAGEAVTGMITGKVKGGFTVEFGQVRAFLPGSLVDVRPVRDPSYLEGKALEFKVIKLDEKRNNIVVSRRAVVEEENSSERSALLDSLKEGQEVKGIVKNLTDYGAFIDLGGIDGLLHITDIAWRRVKHPSEVLTVGDEIDVKILSFDRERNRVSLGMKQLGNDPWSDIIGRYPEGARLKGKITNITDYGCFVEIEDGVEGLVHMSEMDWTNKNIHPSKVVQLGEEVEVMVLEIDQDRRRISLGMKQCVTNPWEDFAVKHQKGDKISGHIRSITDFGIFIGLDGGIDGLVHLSDIAWDTVGEEAVKEFKKNQEVEAVILAVDAERERISLGIKQLSGDPFSLYCSEHGRGAVVSGTVTEVTPKVATVELAPQVMGSLRIQEMTGDKVSDMTQVYSVGSTLEAKVMNVDKKTRSLVLSMKAIEAEQEAEALRKYSRGSEDDQAASSTLGDLLKQQLGNDDTNV